MIQWVDLVFSMYISPELTHVTAFSCWVGWDGMFKMASHSSGSWCWLRAGHLHSPLHKVSFSRKVDWLPFMTISGQQCKDVKVSRKPHRVTPAAFYFLGKSQAHPRFQGGVISRWEKLHNVLLHYLVFVDYYLPKMLYEKKSKFSEARVLESQFLPYPPTLLLLCQWAVWVFDGILLIKCLKEYLGHKKHSVIIHLFY